MSMLESRRLFFTLWWFTLLLKLLWAAYLPLTGDEVYFYLWGKHSGMGYYDHPPMVGWWLTLLLWFGDANWWLRLPAVLLGNGMALGIYLLLRGVVGEGRAVAGAMLFLLSPLVLINVVITTDTPLIFFSFLSAWAFYIATANGHWRWYLVSGLLLGAAFMSKYFAVLLGVSYGLYILLYRRGTRHLLGLLWLFLAVLPFAGLNVWWNYCNCWDNILFNVYNRHGSDEMHLVSYLLMLLYMLTPPLLWYLFKVRRAVWGGLLEGRPYLFLTLVPLGLFLLLSYKVRIGLHWVLAFYPFFFIALVPLLSAQALRRSMKFMLAFSLLHVVALISIFSLPHDYWKERPAVYDSLLLGYYSGDFVQQFNEMADGYHWTTESYVDSAMLEYASGERFSVIGTGSKYGRHDDMLTDWRSLEGENIAVLLYAQVDAEQYQRYFDQVRLVAFSVREREFYMLLGSGFDYAAYRDGVLARIRDSYYRLPSYLPLNGCYLYERYFPAEEVQRLQP